jgi:hypothetical protein
MDSIKTERIRNRAYALSLVRGGQTGDPTADWLEAERQVLSEVADKHVGPAKSYDSRKRGVVTAPSGHDIENPT